MPDNKEHLSIIATNPTPDQPGIILSVYGPRGGVIATVELAPTDAKFLRNRLTRVLEDKGW